MQHLKVTYSPANPYGMSIAQCSAALRTVLVLLHFHRMDQLTCKKQEPSVHALM
jgi:hypothetical protein